ncbi:Outer membrane lipoprotein-sorting protein [Treponema bryantii]|uniref:Outer membrane lipoprotein-sorting protein n=1 Tax=Treponema bryantii TaxID=163 RepID=A0A1I3IPB5_9SPIR|nr:outer membrane lipoprotein-sorting protein [Treponema bryantii]SFI49825.1 Outer membrane lipoprotein-sorting protein [Treponema bryantii]
MKKSLRCIINILICVLFAVPAWTQSADNYADLLKKAEDNTAFYETDFKGSYTVVQNKPGEGQNVTEAIMYRRDKNGSWTILVTGPAKEKGKGYLQFDNNIWFFDPADKRFTFTSAKDKFQNTNANNSDFAPQHYSRDYSIESAEEVTLGKMSCVLFTLKAKTDSVDYPMLKLWVTKDDGLVRKKEDYSLSGQKLRTTAIPSYQLVKAVEKNYSIPVSMLIQDNLKGKKISGKVQYEQTQITIRNVEFAKVPDTVYTKPYLEMMSAK